MSDNQGLEGYTQIRVEDIQTGDVFVVNQNVFEVSRSGDGVTGVLQDDQATVTLTLREWTLLGAVAYRRGLTIPEKFIHVKIGDMEYFKIDPGTYQPWVGIPSDESEEFDWYTDGYVQREAKQYGFSVYGVTATYVGVEE